MPSLSSRTRKQSGQAIIEYILVLIVAITAAGLLAKFTKTAWNQGVIGLGGNLESALKTGRTPSSAWKN